MYVHTYACMYVCMYVCNHMYSVSSEEEDLSDELVERGSDTDSMENIDPVSNDYFIISLMTPPISLRQHMKIPINLFQKLV